ncbi:MAG: VWA domain-containing protein, partial [Acidobacteriota bacterium]
MRRALVTLAAVAAVGASGAAQAPGPQRPADGQPRFETRADIVLVDVSVTDRDGNPIEGLSPSDFRLEVNGETRAIESVQFVPTAAPAAAARVADAGVTSNEDATTGRLLLFVVDENNLRFGGGRAVLRAAERLMESLAPGDAIGVARLPDGVGGVEFTTDRARVREALGRVTGKMQSRSLGHNLRLNEAWAYESRDDITWRAAIDRECRGETGLSLDVCVENLQSEAITMLMDTQARTAASIRAIEGLFDRLGGLAAPVHVIFISEGLFVARDRNSLARAGQLAAEARATVHIIQPAQAFFEAESPDAPGLGFSDNEDLLTEGLDRLAGDTRGARHRVAAGSGAGIFERISRELAGYYLLGFEPTAADRSGRQRRIRVTVSRRGVTVRARSTFAFRDDGAVAAGPATSADEAVRNLLVAPLPGRGLPLRVASYTATSGDDPSKLRLVVAAEIGEAATEPATWPVGVLVVDANGTVVASSLGSPTLAPARANLPSPRLFLTSVLVEPGEYTLRLAAADDTGRAGSVHHAVTARFTDVGPVSVSDLVLTPQVVAGEVPRPSPSAPIDTDAVSAMIEMVGGDPSVLRRARVAVQVAESADGPALVASEARPAARGERQLSFGTSMRLGLLPPGTYVARAIVTVPGRPEARLHRTFRYAPPAGAPAPTVRRSLVELDVDRPAAPPPPSRITAPVPLFQVETVLQPAVVQPFLDGLVDLHPPSAAVAALVDAARKGTFEVPDPDARTAPGDELVLAFVRGLSALASKQPAQARAWFERTLEGASDFLGAAFYLGAAHAAAGRDRDAIGAWQIALLSENPGAVYPLLVDALLRVGDGQGAIEFLEEAPTVWADEHARLRREATAKAMLGEYADALTGLHQLLARGGDDDATLLFVAIQVMYRVHIDTGGLSAAERETFADYVARYRQAGGADAALVETWKRYVL